MDFSYWELKQWIANIDYLVIGSGLVGLNCALNLRKRFPKANILVLEKGILPQGASTKNAGFACFGSLSELLNDLNNHTEEEMVALVERRYEGLKLMRKNLGNKRIGYKVNGGYELFIKGNPDFFEACLENKNRINELLYPYFKKKVFKEVRNEFGFKNIQDYLIMNKFEGTIDTGKMMDSLLDKCRKKNIRILNSVNVLSYEDTGGSVIVKTEDFDLVTNKLLIATNGFAASLIEEDVLPARAQVLITKPVKKLRIKGNFHLEQGYYYFRNVGNRILFGGGRNLDPEGETTTSFGNTDLIQNKLEELLKNVILPDTPFEIEHRWSGIMGVGETKTPILKQLSDNVYCGVRMGGMGVAIGSLVGKDLAHLIE